MKPVQDKAAETAQEIYYEDLSVGQTFGAGPIEVTAEAIMDFARQYDPQDFHTDPERAKHTIFGGLIGSGWHTACLTMRLVLQSSPKIKGGMVGRSVERMGWPRAVRPGDKLTYQGEIIDLRTSNSSPDRGIMRVKNTTYNQNKEPVLEMETVVFVPRRVKK
jgi:acyl dehydratase